MAILAAEAILKRLNVNDSNGIIVAPILERAEQIRAGQASIDVRLGCTFRLVEASSEDVVDTVKNTRRAPAKPPIYVPLGSSIVLHPHQLLLGETMEFVRLPTNVMCNVMGRSSWARDGLLVATAVGVHPSYSGCVTLELRNLGEVPIRLYPGDLIAQLFFEEVVGATDVSTQTQVSQFAGAGGPRRGSHRYKVTREKLDRLSKKHNPGPRP